jgi:hypothetical protein
MGGYIECLETTTTTTTGSHPTIADVSSALGGRRAIVVERRWQTRTELTEEGTR